MPIWLQFFQVRNNIIRRGEFVQKLAKATNVNSITTNYAELSLFSKTNEYEMVVEEQFKYHVSVGFDELFNLIAPIIGEVVSR